mgnify:CR=1 FL=1
MIKPLSLTVLLLLSIVLLTASARLMLASMWATQANSFLLDWQEKAQQPTDSAWQVAFKAANKSIALSPVANADYYDTLGQVWEWKQFEASQTDPAAIETREQALNAYRRSIELKPQWPYTVIKLAYVKLRLNQIDTEFNQSLQNAFNRGPWRIDINKRIAEMSLMAWPQLTNDNKVMARTAIKRTVNYGPSDAKWLESRAKTNNRHALFCLLLPHDMKEKRQICKEVQTG